MPNTPAGDRALREFTALVWKMLGRGPQSDGPGPLWRPMPGWPDRWSVTLASGRPTEEIEADQPLIAEA